MKTLSIKELHSHTGKWVRSASSQSITLTDRGQPVAELGPLSQNEKVSFPRRSISDLPKSKCLDSTALISEERDGR